MDKIRFGITGNAFVAFGGDKVLIEGGANTDMNVGVLALSELKENSNKDNRYGVQVQMVFPNIRSIQVLRDALDGLEDLFKDGVIKEQEEQNELKADGQSPISGKLCPKCGERMVCDKDKVLTSNPAQYEYKCPQWSYCL